MHKLVLIKELETEIERVKYGWYSPAHKKELLSRLQDDLTKLKLETVLVQDSEIKAQELNNE